MATCSSGSSWGFSGSRSCDQSMRAFVFHWRFFPFSYRERSDSRPSWYSQRKTVSKSLATFHSLWSSARAYRWVVVMGASSGPSAKRRAPDARRASRAAGVPVDLPEAGQGRGELEVPAEALEARPVRQPLDDQVDEFLPRRVAGIAEVEAAALPALGAAHVDVHRARGVCHTPRRASRGGYDLPAAAARFLTPCAAARKASRVPVASTPIGTACAMPWPSRTRKVECTRERVPSGEGSTW